MCKNLILLHGALGSKKQFTELSKNLSTDFNVLSFDFSGHGEHSSHRAFTIDVFTENLYDFIKENQLKETHIFGYSMGGYVAINFAKKHSQLVNQIITLGTKFNWTEEFAAQEAKRLNPAKIEEKVPQFAQHLSKMHLANPWKEVVQRTASMMIGLGKEKPLQTEDFKNITPKVLLLLGEKDHMVSAEETKEVAKLLPNGEFLILKNEQHLIEKVNTANLANILKEAFNK